MALEQSLNCGLLPSWFLQKEQEQCVHTISLIIELLGDSRSLGFSTGKIDYKKDFCGEQAMLICYYLRAYSLECF